MPPPAEPYDNRPIDSGVQPCQPCHWFKIELVHADKGQPRPAHWPKEKLAGYPSEPMTIQLAGVAPPQQALDGSGRFEANSLPGGDATVKFHAFYADIEDALKKGRIYP